jgi:hypothetical protein
MRRVNLRLLVDSVLLGAALLTFASGLVLLLAFHVDHGTARSSALGLGRLAWLNLHRIPALVVAAGLMLHLAVDWKAFRTRLRNFVRRDRNPHAVAENLLCLTLATAVLAGLAAWLLLDGSALLLAPAPRGPASASRHGLIDIHNVAGLVALPLAVHHIAHRWRWLVRTIQSLAR